METFTEPKELVDNPQYQEQRHRTLGELSDGMIDAPIVELINGLNKLPHCFTLQSCYGHFVHDKQEDPHNLESLPLTNSIDKVEYRIAYVGFCIENSDSGKELLEALKRIIDIDPENIQLCCSEWFWRRQVNSYALQVEPDRFKHRDKAVLDCDEALHIQGIRNEFFVGLHRLVEQQLMSIKSIQ